MAPGAWSRVRGSRWKRPQTGADVATARNQPDYEQAGRLAADM
jgi:hypothetical protein